MEAFLDKWKEIPEWGRWILCWPLMLLLPFLAGLLFNIIFSSTAWRYGLAEISQDIYTPNSFSEFWVSGLTIVVQSSVFFFSIFYLVPRAQDIVAALFTVLAVIMNVLGMVGVIIGFNDGESTLIQCVAGIILMCIGSAAAIYWAYNIRNSVKNGEQLVLT